MNLDPQLIQGAKKNAGFWLWVYGGVLTFEVLVETGVILNAPPIPGPSPQTPPGLHSATDWMIAGLAGVAVLLFAFSPVILQLWTDRLRILQEDHSEIERTAIYIRNALGGLPLLTLIASATLQFAWAGSDSWLELPSAEILIPFNLILIVLLAYYRYSVVPRVVQELEQHLGYSTSSSV